MQFEDSDIISLVNLAACTDEINQDEALQTCVANDLVSRLEQTAKVRLYQEDRPKIEALFSLGVSPRSSSSFPVTRQDCRTDIGSIEPGRYRYCEDIEHNLIGYVEGVTRSGEVAYVKVFIQQDGSTAALFYYSDGQGNRSSMKLVKNSENTCSWEIDELRMRGKNHLQCLIDGRRILAPVLASMALERSVFAARTNAGKGKQLFHIQEVPNLKTKMIKDF